MDNNNTQLTDEQIDMINKEMEDLKNSNDTLKVLSDLPSNNGVEENTNMEEGTFKKMNVAINPDTGEHIIYSEADDSDDKSFEELLDNINNETTMLTKNDAPINEDEYKEYADSVKNDDDSMFRDIFGDEDNYNPEVMTKILDH